MIERRRKQLESVLRRFEIKIVVRKKAKPTSPPLGVSVPFYQALKDMLDLGFDASGCLHSSILTSTY